MMLQQLYRLAVNERKFCQKTHIRPMHHITTHPSYEPSWHDHATVLYSRLSTEKCTKPTVIMPFMPFSLLATLWPRHLNHTLLCRQSVISSR